MCVIKNKQKSFRSGYVLYWKIQDVDKREHLLHSSVLHFTVWESLWMNMTMLTTSWQHKQFIMPFPQRHRPDHNIRHFWWADDHFSILWTWLLPVKKAATDHFSLILAIVCVWQQHCTPLLHILPKTQSYPLMFTTHIIKISLDKLAFWTMPQLVMFLVLAQWRQHVILASIQKANC